MAVPAYQTLMLPVLRCYATYGEQQISQVAEHIAAEFNLSDADLSQLMPSGKQRLLHNRVHWAKFYLSKAGLVESVSKGRFIVTGAGQKMLASKPATISLKTLLAIPTFAAFYYKSDQPDDGAVPGANIPTATAPDLSPEERIEVAARTMQEALQSELLDRIGQNTPAFFEQLIVALLVAMGYGGSYQNAAQQLGKSGDGGVDGVINEDRLGLDRVYVQAKRYAAGNTIGRPEIQGFVGSLVGLGATKGVFVTTSSFSSQARDYVRNISQRVVLMDGVMLTALMIEHGVGVRISQTIAISRLDEDFFAEEN